MRDRPDYSREDDLMRPGHARIAGVDEAGRGPIAGPVTAAAVILNPHAIPEGLNDSKKLTSKRREYLFDALMRVAHVSVAHASVAEIETLNIRMATHLAMRRALLGLDVPPDHVLIDGRDVPDGLPCPGRAIIGGRRQITLDCRGFGHCQGDARQGDGGFGATPSGLWMGTERRLSHKKPHCCLK